LAFFFFLEASLSCNALLTNACKLANNIVAFVGPVHSVVTFSKLCSIAASIESFIHDAPSSFAISYSTIFRNLDLELEKVVLFCYLSLPQLEMLCQMFLIPKGPLVPMGDKPDLDSVA
jgi:hypothetical protein